MGPRGRSGQVRKISPPPGFDPRITIPTTLPGPLSWGASVYLAFFVTPVTNEQLNIWCVNSGVEKRNKNMCRILCRHSLQSQKSLM